MRSTNSRARQRFVASKPSRVPETPVPGRRRYPRTRRGLARHVLTSAEPQRPILEPAALRLPGGVWARRASNIRTDAPEEQLVRFTPPTRY